jgi:hypothetical protein
MSTHEQLLALNGLLLTFRMAHSLVSYNLFIIKPVFKILIDIDSVCILFVFDFLPREF